MMLLFMALGLGDAVTAECTPRQNSGGYLRFVIGGERVGAGPLRHMSCRLTRLSRRGGTTP